MGIPCYLAMTAAEMLGNTPLPEKLAWMACQFSPYGTGLSNLPSSLPPNRVLMLSDETPICGHDPQRIFAELQECIARFSCRCLVLDFQRPGNPAAAELVSALMALPCPLIVSQPYAREGCDVLLPPAPLSVSLEDYLSPWKGREIWLELAMDGEILTLTEQGAKTIPLPYPNLSAEGFREEILHCHYRTQLSEDRAEFTLWRTEEDLADLIQEAEKLGVTAMIGLFQEFYATDIGRGHDSAGQQ
ncbi:MAG: hypothetical protein IJN67_14215 [Oscillospiraceae bacterium]|nr:hypothetical protein [Oscillospiraceae bacterium]